MNCQHYFREIQYGLSYLGFKKFSKCNYKHLSPGENKNELCLLYVDIQWEEKFSNTNKLL